MLTKTQRKTSALTKELTSNRGEVMLKLLNVVAVAITLLSLSTGANAAPNNGKLDSSAFRPLSGANDIRTDARMQKLDASAFRPLYGGEWPNDIRTDARQHKTLEWSYAPRGGVFGTLPNDIRTDARSQEIGKLDAASFYPGKLRPNDIRTDARSQNK